MNPLLHSEIFILTLVTGVYLAALWLYRKTRLSLLHPLLVSIPVLALGIRFLGIPFATFEAGSRIINFLLGPTVVALGYLLYEQREHLKANGISGPFILDRLGIRSRIARGLALGSAAHGLGTARAMELGAIEGAISGLAIGVMGIMTAILVPVIEWLLNL